MTKCIFALTAVLFSLAGTRAQANCSQHTCGQNPRVTWQCDCAFLTPRLKVDGHVWNLSEGKKTEALAAVLTVGAMYRVEISEDLQHAQVFQNHSLLGELPLGELECTTH